MGHGLLLNKQKIHWDSSIAIETFLGEDVDPECRKCDREEETPHPLLAEDGNTYMAHFQHFGSRQPLAMVPFHKLLSFMDDPAMV